VLWESVQSRDVCWNHADTVLQYSSGVCAFTMSRRDTRKRPGPKWKDSPAFLDAAASVSATTFGARRLPEMKSLRDKTEGASIKPNLSVSVKEYQSGGKKSSSRHLRKRTTSYKPRSKRYRCNATPGDAGNKGHTEDRGETKKMSVTRLVPTRRARRKLSILRGQHESWNDDSTLNWMSTHVWHAKRFHMHPNLFGWKVPLLHCNRGAGAAIRLAKEGRTLLQDVSWRMQPLLVGATDLEALCQSMNRICPAFDFQKNAGAILNGIIMGSGMIYQLDKFPSNAIGQVIWWISRTPIGGSDLTNGDKLFWVHLFLHASTMPVVESLLTDLLDASEQKFVGPERLESGIACFQIRGARASESLMNALHPQTDPLRGFDFEKPSNSANKPQTLSPHLSCVHARILGESGAVSSTSDEGISGSPRFIVGGRNVLLVSQVPCDPSLSMNWASCGWDIICHRAVAHNIFQALIHAGNACAIGLVEEAHIRMENEPPLPVFPRDYPDTVDGTKYWREEDSDWSLVRRSFDTGQGRVPVTRWLRPTIPIPALPAVPWSKLTDPSMTADVVVVRGDFGKPFVDALNGSGQVARCDRKSGETAKNRRNRRRARPPTAVAPTLALQESEAAAYQQTCSALLQALSLPAILRCHLVVIGKGSIIPGCFIYSLFPLEETPEDHFLLGISVAGGFSAFRGAVCGLGFVGAARLLRVLRSSRGPSSTVSVQTPCGDTQIQLKVHLERRDKSNRVPGVIATMSLIL
jgi:hypothetical protein